VDGLDYNAIAQIGQQGAFEHYRYSGQKHKSFLFRCCACAGQPLNTLVSEETGDCRSYLFGSLEWRKVSDPVDGLERGVRYQGKQCLTQGGLFLDLVRRSDDHTHRDCDGSGLLRDVKGHPLREPCNLCGFRAPERDRGPGWSTGRNS
jgi:hypothetical protein